MKQHAPTPTGGFTLVETLVTLAILAVLAGLVYTGLAPVRERARETHCFNNLMQISKAIQMYRQDYGGQDPPGALTYSQLGLPPSPSRLWPYLRSRDVFRCPSEYWGPEEPGPGKFRPVSYIWHIEPDEEASLRVPRFSQVVAKRGQDTPLATDPHHGMKFRSALRKPVRMTILRLSGQVERRFVPWEAPSWEE